MLLAADSGQLTALRLLDLTAASDTVDHDLLLLRLERQFGFQGVALQWFRSYLSGRSFRVLYCNQSSTAVYIVCSVPQGSVIYKSASFYLRHGGPCRRSQASPSEHARMLMILSCICTVVSMIQLLLSHGWRSALVMSATGWPPTASS